MWSLAAAQSRGRGRAADIRSRLLGDRVASVRAVEPHTLELTLKRPYSPLAQLLSATNLTPLSPRAYRHHSRRFLNERFVGTGPYRLRFFNPANGTPTYELASDKPLAAAPAAREANPTRR